MSNWSDFQDEFTCSPLSAATDGIVLKVADEIQVSHQRLRQIIHQEDPYLKFLRVYRAILRIDPTRAELVRNHFLAFHEQNNPNSKQVNTRKALAIAIREMNEGFSAAAFDCESSESINEICEGLNSVQELLISILRQRQQQNKSPLM